MHRYMGFDQAMFENKLQLTAVHRLPGGQQDG